MRVSDTSGRINSLIHRRKSCVVWTGVTKINGFVTNQSGELCICPGETVVQLRWRNFLKLSKDEF